MENELVKEILANIGMPGVIISIIILIAKISPITAISSSWVEMNLSTKEKRLSIKIIRSFFEIIFLVVFLLLISDVFFTNEGLYNPWIAIVSAIIIFSIFIWILILDSKGKSLISYIKSDWPNWKKIVIFIFFIVYFFSLLILPSYYVGTQVYSEVYNELLEEEERIGAFIAVVMLFFFYIVSIYPTVFKTLYRFLGFRRDLINNLTVEIDNEPWYLFHPVEKDYFLLGNKYSVEECTKFRFIKKEELLNRVVEYNKNAN